MLSPERIEEIERSSWELIQKVFPKKIPIPIPLEKIAKHLGFTVSEGETRNKDTYAIFDEGKRIIFVQRSSHYHRKVFSIARMLARSILHDKAFVRELTIEPIQSGEEEQGMELEAALFARCLLIPRAILKAYAKSSDYHDSFQVADLFGVSPEVVRSRLRQLGMPIPPLRTEIFFVEKEADEQRKLRSL